MEKIQKISGDGVDFYGRTGYPMSATGGTAAYMWKSSGQLIGDRSRNIAGVVENHLGLPTRINFASRNYIEFLYDANGGLIRSQAFMPVFGSPTLTQSRSYAGNRVFSGDTIVYSRFAGGYFDHDGAVHYNITDYQGSVTMVIDSLRMVEQHNGYYPYGEPWREPGGQPFLFSEKERNRLFNLNDYDFHARRLTPATALWNAPDPLAGKYPNLNPYTYCAGNPIAFIDPSGMKINLHPFIAFDEISDSDYAQILMSDLSNITGLSISCDNNGFLQYDKDDNGSPIISKTTQNGIIVNNGSETARNLLTGAIDSSSEISVQYAPRSALDGQKLGLNPSQITNFINGANEVDGNTLGFGMTMLHELYHSSLGGNYDDTTDDLGMGDVVDRMNIIRAELNNLGFNYGQRMNYKAIIEPNGGSIAIPFNQSALDSLLNGRDLNINDKYIRINFPK